MLTAIVPPSIDPFSPKNQEMEPDRVRAILRQAGLLAPIGRRRRSSRSTGVPTEARRGSSAAARSPARASFPAADARLVVQVSRWDRLKDPAGVMHGFAEVLAAGHDAWLILAGPSLGSVTDDPDGAAVLAEVEADWRRLPEAIRSRVLLACLPMDDLDENGAIVNALQRQATIVVQKSLKEGFGLTVTEAMWKARPVVATATGGIGDQIEDGVSGVLLRNPLDLKAFAASVGDLLADPERAQAIGEAARESVRAQLPRGSPHPAVRRAAGGVAGALKIPRFAAEGRGEGESFGGCALRRGACCPRDEKSPASSSARTTRRRSSCSATTWWRTASASCRRPAPPTRCGSAATSSRT